MCFYYSIGTGPVGKRSWWLYAWCSRERGICREYYIINVFFNFLLVKPLSQDFSGALSFSPILTIGETYRQSETQYVLRIENRSWRMVLGSGLAKSLIKDIIH